MLSGLANAVRFPIRRPCRRLYAIFCSHDEVVVGAWSKDEDDAVMAKLAVVHSKLAAASPAAAGTIRMPFGVTFWSKGFGMCGQVRDSLDGELRKLNAGIAKPLHAPERS